MLRVDRSLEPKWLILNERINSEIRISANDREKLGLTRLGPYVDKHLTWARGSILTRITGELDEIPSILAEVDRNARLALREDGVDFLNEAAQRVQDLVQHFGVTPHYQYQAALDSRLSIGRQSNLALHDGEIPTRMAGLGSRRLIALAIQNQEVKDGAIILVDEIKSGLEPHRLRHLLRILRPGDDSSHQIFMTTHSIISIVELTANELNIVRSVDGTTDVKLVDASLQNIVRKAPEAFLGKKIIVCEGKTEVGIWRYLDTYWQRNETTFPFSCLGVVLIDGGGSDASKTALEMKKLGFDVALFSDSDVPINPTIEELLSEGVMVIQWAGKSSTEDRVAADIPFKNLKRFN